MKATDEQVETIIGFLRDLICDEPCIPFHENSFFFPFPASLPRKLGAEDQSLEKLRHVLEEGAQAAELQCPALRAALRDNLYGVDLSVKDEAEWEDVRRWAFQTQDASQVLSRPAAELLTRIENGDIRNKFISEMSLRRRIRLYGFNSNLELVLEEIRLKRGITLVVEEKGEAWHQRKHLLKITVESRKTPVPMEHGLNPIIPSEVMNSPDSERQFRRWFARTLLEAPQAGTETLSVWTIQTRKEFFRCFPWLNGTAIDSQKIIPWLKVVQQNPAFSVGWNLEPRKQIWTIIVRPYSSWDATKVVIKQQLDQKTAEEEFGLGSPAAALFEWLRSIPENELELGLTPIVEDALKSKSLLLKCPWEKENLPLYLKILCAEVNDLTPLRVEAVKWAKGGTVVNRILITRFSRI